MTRQAWTRGLAFLLPLLLSVAALAQEPGGEFQVTSANHGDSLSSVAMDDDGAFVVSWVSGDVDVQARRFDRAGEPLGPEFLVGIIGATYAGPTSVALDRSGFLVVWENDHKYFGSILRGQRLSRTGAALSSAFSPTATAQPSVASDPRGNSVIAGSSAQGTVVTRRDWKGRQIGRDIPVAAHGRFPDVTVDGAGNFVVAWVGEHGLYARRYSVTGAPDSPTIRVTRNLSAPALAGNRDGEFAVAWRAGSSLFARFYSSTGEPRTTPVLISNQADSETYLSAAMDAEGKVLVTWSCCVAGGATSSAIYGRWLDSSGKPFGGTFRVSTPTRYQTRPSAASGPRNRFLVVWEAVPASAPLEAGTTIFARRLAWPRRDRSD